MSAHRCHAVDCPTPVPPAKLMCLHHWYMVPVVLRHDVWNAYVPGQEIRKDPTPEYLAAADAAIQAVAEKEGKR